jgi:hypothetical protein
MPPLHKYKSNQLYKKYAFNASQNSHGTVSRYTDKYQFYIPSTLKKNKEIKNVKYIVLEIIHLNRLCAITSYHAKHNWGKF